MSKPFDEALKVCLRLLESGAGIDDVLARYPEQAGDLRHHLHVWASLSSVEEAQPGPEADAHGRKRLLAAVAAGGERRGTNPVRTLTSAGGMAGMKYVALFVAGAAVALGIAFLTGSLDFGSDSGSSAEASHLPACVTSLDFNGDDALTVEDVMAFRNAIENQDPAFDYNGDTVVDIHDVVAVVGQVINCFQQQQPPLP